MSPPAPIPKPRPTGDPGESGFAIVLAMIFTILLYILVAELSVSGQMVRAIGENDALLARMRNQMLYQLREAQDQLLTDMQGASAGGGEEGGLGGLAGGLAGGAAGDGGGPPGGGEAAAGAGGMEEGEEPDPSTVCDSSRDAWFQPSGATDNDLTTYTWVEDENRKLNILGLWSEDEDFAQLTRERMVRLIDSLREDSEFDVPGSDAELIVTELMDWARRGDTESIPRPKLKSDPRDQIPETTIPLHLDELLLLPTVSEELFYDMVMDGKVYLGLESVLTIWTSLKVDPGDPEKLARQRAIARARGEEPPPGEEEGEAGAGESPLGEGEGQIEQPQGVGIRINVNTASRQVLRALFGYDKIPDRVIDGIIRYRNEVDEEAMLAQEEGTPETDVSLFGDMRLGENQPLKVFQSIGDLENVEEFEALADPEVKAEFQTALTTSSDVFSIHLATIYKRNEKNRTYLLRRARSIVLRLDDGEDGKIIPLVPFEERSGMRVMPIDMQDEKPLDLTSVYVDMDQFAQDERAWDPFLVDFYLPKRMRDEFYSSRR